MAWNCGYFPKKVMEKKVEKRSSESEQQPGSMSSYNNRTPNREGEVEETKEHKDESQSRMDYNSNLEENAPARTEK